MPPVLPAERLRRFVRAIEPTPREVATASDRAGRIGRRLQRDMDVRKILPVGSHWKGTAVRRYSDYDLFVVLSRDEARKWSPSMRSSTLIGRVRNSIHASYPNTSLRIDQQAVRVSFEQGAHSVDVVPAIFERFDAGHGAPVYLIPDGADGWLSTSPDLHRWLVDDAHQRSGRKLKSLVRMLKWWSASRHGTYRISSLYLEWFVIWCAIPPGYTYQESLATVFHRMVSDRLTSLADPFGISTTPVHGVSTATQRGIVLDIASQSARRATEALAAEDRGRFVSANDRWSLVFNRKFPAVWF